jgi:hypothetical protein
MEVKQAREEDQRRKSLRSSPQYSLHRDKRCRLGTQHVATLKSKVPSRRATGQKDLLGVDEDQRALLELRVELGVDAAGVKRVSRRSERMKRLVKNSLRPHVLHILHGVMNSGLWEETIGSRNESPATLLAALDEPFWDAGLFVSVVERADVVPENTWAGV